MNTDVKYILFLPLYTSTFVLVEEILQVQYTCGGPLQLAERG